MKKKFSIGLMFLIIANLYAAGVQEEHEWGKYPFYQAQSRGATQLEIEAPANDWGKSLPLGNGEMGMMVWGTANQLKFSIDRADLWDCRDTLGKNFFTFSDLARWVKNGDFDRIKKERERIYGISYPTKVSGARLTYNLGLKFLKKFSLDFSQGEGQVTLLNEQKISIFFVRDLPVALVQFPHELNPSLKQFSMLLPGQQRTESYKVGVKYSTLGYPQAEVIQNDSLLAFIQASTTDFAYSIGVFPFGEDTFAIYAIAKEGLAQKEKFYEELTALKNKLSQKNVSEYKQANRDWWKNYSATSSVQINDSAMLYQYNFAKYIYGAGAREGMPPIPLQGLWTDDSEFLPPWRGDFHNDLNVQMTYWPVFVANSMEAACSYTEYLEKLKPEFERYANEYFGVKNAIAVPGVMSLNGSAIGSWFQYCKSPIAGTWVAQHYYWQWKYTNDTEFLKEKAYPFLKGCANLLEGIMFTNEKGYLTLPLSTSPEIYNADPKSWLPANSTNDQSLIIWLYRSLSEMAQKLNNGEKEHWEKVLTQLEPLPIDEKGSLMYAKGLPANESHRHHSHLMGIYPLQILSSENSADEAKIISASLARLNELQYKAWNGFSYPWASCLEAVSGNAEMADWYLSLFAYAFTAKNGFHTNGNTRRIGTTTRNEYQLTLEANFAAMQALHLMLLQNRGDVVFLFPAFPKRLGDASFSGLRVYGGATVSATLKNGLVATLTVTEIEGRQTEIIFNTANLPQKWLQDGKGFVDEKGFWHLALKPNESCFFNSNN